jgi:hypothetical protein
MVVAHAYDFYAHTFRRPSDFRSKLGDRAVYLHALLTPKFDFHWSRMRKITGRRLLPEKNSLSSGSFSYPLTTSLLTPFSFKGLKPGIYPSGADPLGLKLTRL